MKNKKQDILGEIINPPKLISTEYHTASKYCFENIRQKFVEIPKVWTTIHFKQYQRFKAIQISKPLKIRMNVAEAIKKRQSVRKYSKTSIRFQDISTILKISAGMKRKEKNMDFTRRGQPSAGARYPVELYVVSLNCNGLEKGIYHYNVKQDTLELLRKGISKKELRQYFDQPWMFDSAFILLISGVFGRTNIKYGERGYRYVLLEAGHVAQNISLVATSLGLGSCCIGGFQDEKLNKMLDLQEENEAIVYVLVVGNVARN